MPATDNDNSSTKKATKTPGSPSVPRKTTSAASGNAAASASVKDSTNTTTSSHQNATTISIAASTTADASTSAASASISQSTNENVNATTNNKEKDKSKQDGGNSIKDKQPKQQNVGTSKKHSISVVSGDLNNAATTSNKKQKTTVNSASTNPPGNDSSASDKDKNNSSNTTTGGRTLIDDVLFRLTDGIPKRELKIMLTEANECEAALLKEIEMLEKSLEMSEKNNMNMDNSSSSDNIDGTSSDKVDNKQSKKNDDGTKTKQGNTPTAGSSTRASSAAAVTTNTTSSSITTTTTTTTMTRTAAVKAGALNSTASKGSKSALSIILENPLTPVDRCYTFSALVGRLRDNLTIPSNRNILLSSQMNNSSSGGGHNNKNNSENNPSGDASNNNNNHATTNTAPAPKKKKIGVALNPQLMNQQLIGLNSMPAYTNIHKEPQALLVLWRKIASHRTAMVFRRPVKPEEAPGYNERIFFPMDLSLIRKMIVAKIIQTYKAFHQRVALISHNCVKYNGRESDYGVVAREFEAVVDEYVLNSVVAATSAISKQANTPTNAAATSA